MQINVRPFAEEDRSELDNYRWRYQDADLEVPHDFMDTNVETVVALKDGRLLGSLTGTLSITLDPFIKNPDASPLELMQALLKMETVLNYMAQKLGAVDVYIAIPNQIVETYGKIVEKCGYERTVQNCTVYRKPLRPDTQPLIGKVRDEQARQARQTAEHVVSHPPFSAGRNDDIGERDNMT